MSIAGPYRGAANQFFSGSRCAYVKPITSNLRTFFQDYITRNFRHLIQIRWLVNPNSGSDD
jgi:hypothetical protein